MFCFAASRFVADPIKILQARPENLRPFPWYMRALLVENWIPETRNRLARRRAKKPDTKAGQIWPLLSEIKAAPEIGPPDELTCRSAFQRLQGQDLRERGRDT
jgi:hypothetical protein